MERRDDKLVTGWKDEMNNLLIFVSFFGIQPVSHTILSRQVYSLLL